MTVRCGEVSAIPLSERLAEIARASARGGARAAGAGDSRMLKDTRVTVVRAGDVVVKAHPPGTDEAALAARLRVAAALPGVLLPPLDERVRRVGDRLVTVWPAGEPVDPADPDAAPWEAAAGLLARLHAVPADGLALPPAGGPARLLEAVTRLGDLLDGTAPSGEPARYAAAAGVIREAFLSLPSGVTDTGPGAGMPTHGDWHLGQIIRYQGEWLLIDVDDLGAGTPSWDLARPAAWFATGFLSPDLWRRFLSAYLGAGGSAVPHGDPWRELDVPARALTVQLAATAVAAARTEGRPLDDVEHDLVSSCGRIIRAAAPQ
ncbi:aminoglycoside phosphotransferase family protein [Sphaerisporangium sp. NBC_01403]|uniref:aminoglycoside phosphotransferase family protein n=1 Tax=Sphaerisporangium sp. NBC_01403 TaxID=2903599 RepID=UPI003252DF9B